MHDPSKDQYHDLPEDAPVYCIDPYLVVEQPHWDELRADDHFHRVRENPAADRTITSHFLC